MKKYKAIIYDLDGTVLNTINTLDGLNMSMNMKKALLYTQGLKKFLKHLTEASFKQLLQQKQQHSIKLILLQKV